MKVIILAGGRGTRLPESAKDIPKALVEVHGKTILDHQLELLEKYDLTDVRLSLGFRADQVIAHLAKTARDNVEYIVEEEPLGTGGALRFATKDLKDDFMVLNGDLITQFNFQEITRSHMPGFPLIVSVWLPDARDFGLLALEGDCIKAFLEKPKTSQPGFINAGCYILHPKHLSGNNQKSFMLETDTFPQLAVSGKLRTFIHRGFWQDVGTEERLKNTRLTL